ncbi:alpha/beta fold hydrolase [Solirhodobacter olei]|uniref:alpha/beta fold hydrolase n=1 Tax=Solirhodobacter olei TaxID=2493082 RepID=UPI000FDC11B6|nr:alpha/beta hydrolase [Solirhodobacter olei]
MSTASDTIKLHVEDLGTGAPALVFLHYWGGSSRTWRHVTQALAPAFRTIAVDQRGWGRSDKPVAGYTLAGLVLVAPSPPSPMGVPLEIRQGMVQAYDTRDSIIATVRQVLARTPLAPDDLEQVVTDSLQGAPAARLAWPLEASQEDITAQAAQIRVPTLVVSGEEDRVDPPAVLRQELMPRIPQARLHLLPGIGHLSPLEAPDDLADLIRSFATPLI